MDKDKTCTATFDRIRNTLTVIKKGITTGKVTSSPVGIDCGDVCSGQYNQGLEVKLTAFDDDTTDAGFDQWQGCSTVNDRECLVFVDADKTVTALFRKKISMKVQQGIVNDKKKGIDKDKITLKLTECKELENAVADLDTSSVHITVKADEVILYERDIPGTEFSLNKKKSRYKHKGKKLSPPEKHKDILTPGKEKMTFVIKKAEILNQVPAPQEVQFITVSVAIGNYVYESRKSWSFINNSKVTKYIK